jgi:dTDP-4-amino-4,6-dideoxygalactose transaminase
VHYPKAVTEQPVIRERCPGIPPCPISEAVAREVVCLPVHHDLSDEQIARVAEGVAKIATCFSS